ncbi:ferredoxin--NADP reductase [Stratiformator vulcanicus]|uniref:Ferredoxin--NADP reductase n=1 Tax=Stratiformator vulcanicus TaxID=2527980 RepID=A0A517R7K6_9PLAN|nr:ferredoxin--NADP reductase [Stratiformator vulcanicus]QDT39801.1 Ferredoxin--NADP reductase [Stratiformator vulcanicus]
MPTLMKSRPASPRRSQSKLNATVTAIRKPTDELMVLTVRTDEPILNYTAGRSVGLGLPANAPSIGVSTPGEAATKPRSKMIRRSYSVSAFRPSQADSELEFLIALVNHESDEPPHLTPRLFALEVNSRLFVSPKAFGRYTAEGVQPHHDVLLLGTGTGEAPHVAIADALLSAGHRGRVAVVTGVRTRGDVGYAKAHRDWEQVHSDYQYHVLTTREPENLEIAHPRFIGKEYLQSAWSSGRLFAKLDWTPSPATTHVFLCGNPAMIGSPHPSRLPIKSGMVARLQDAGFRIGTTEPGSIRFERYW